jgi:hypothetical protein
MSSTPSLPRGDGLLMDFTERCKICDWSKTVSPKADDLRSPGAERRVADAKTFVKSALYRHMRSEHSAPVTL